MKFLQPLKNQCGAVILTIAVIWAIGAPVLYVTGRYMQHRRADIENVHDKLATGKPITDEELDRAHTAVRDVGKLAQASGSILNSTTNIGGSQVKDAVAIIGDTAISETVSRSTSPPATSSRTLPNDVPLRATSCNTWSLSNCASRSSCLQAGGFWHSNNFCRSYPEPGCNAEDLSRCRSQLACTNAGGYWQSNPAECTAHPNVCSEENLHLCMNAQQCAGAGGHWYDDRCNQSPEGCYAGSPELCANERDCLNADGFWFNNSCHEDPEFDPVTVNITSPASGTETSANQVVVTANYRINQTGSAVASVGFNVNGNFQSATLSRQTFSSTAVLNTGENRIEAIVMTETGERYASPPITVRSSATNNTYHIRIVWDKDDTDVDLHFSWSGGRECFFGNEAPNWGNAQNSPRLDVDDTDGYGPENITIDRLPGPGQYRIYIDYFSDHGNGGTNVTATIFENGVPIMSGSRYMTDGETWTLFEFSL